MGSNNVEVKAEVVRSCKWYKGGWGVKGWVNMQVWDDDFFLSWVFRHFLVKPIGVIVPTIIDNSIGRVSVGIFPGNSISVDTAASLLDHRHLRASFQVSTYVRVGPVQLS